MDTYEHKKERIKLLTLNNVPGAQTLYSKIPFFMRSRLSGLIDYIQWEDIKNGCDNNDHSAFQKARSAFDELIKKMEQYLEVAKQQNKEAGSDNMMLMRTDLNYIINQYKDAVSFVRAMAECIQKEDDLILEYCSYKEESSPISDNQSPVKFNRVLMMMKNIKHYFKSDKQPNTKVRMQDLESTLHYSFRQEVAIIKAIEEID
ncbi:hypothetical protein Btru_025660 [Bulinus truncatus]|nr:hypothetical protein Btru_025660 [Bulinus truncatus]